MKKLGTLTSSIWSDMLCGCHVTYINVECTHYFIRNRWTVFCSHKKNYVF